MHVNRRDQAEGLSRKLLEYIRGLSEFREVLHCGRTFEVSPFEIYAVCPVCSMRIKVRATSAETEIEDVFDAVFAWLDRPGRVALMEQRQKQIREDED